MKSGEWHDSPWGLRIHRKHDYFDVILLRLQQKYKGREGRCKIEYKTTLCVSILFRLTFHQARNLMLGIQPLVLSAPYSTDIRNRNVMTLKSTEPSGTSLPAMDALGKNDLFEKERPSIEQAENYLVSFTPQEQKQILRKVDWRLVPLLSFLYLVSFIDRGNRNSTTILLLLHLRLFANGKKWAMPKLPD